MKATHLGPEDVEEFLAIRAEGLAGDSDAFRVTVADDDSLGKAAWRARLQRDHVVAVRDDFGAMLGVGGFSQLTGEKLAHKGLIWGMYVKPQSRGTGVADQILAALIEHGRAHVRQLQLTVMADNDRARAFYARFGFVLYAIEPASVRRDSEYADEALMWLLLPGPASPERAR